MDTGLAYLSVAEAVQPALLTSSERPNIPNDWEKIPTVKQLTTHPKAELSYSTPA